MGFLSKLLAKRGIKDASELSPEERQTFEHWERILSTGQVSVDSITHFCENQIKRIEASWKNLDNPEKKNERLIIQHSVYSTLLNLIKSPGMEKEALEKYLVDLIDK